MDEKWKSIATCGIWIGAAVGYWGAPDPSLFAAAAFATIMMWLLG